MSASGGEPGFELGPKVFRHLGGQIAYASDERAVAEPGLAELDELGAYSVRAVAANSLVALRIRNNRERARDAGIG